MLARVNSMYRIRDGNVTLIVKGDPQQSHQSYLIPSLIEMVNGDYLVGQCVYDNDLNRVIQMGSISFLKKTLFRLRKCCC